MTSRRTEAQHAQLRSFIELLERTPAEFAWSLDSDWRVRGRYGAIDRLKPVSPLCAVAYMVSGQLCGWDILAEEIIGLGAVLGKVIRVASDYRDGSDLRGAILSAVRVREGRK